MKYSQEFLDLAYSALHWNQPDTYVRLISAVDDNKHTSVRYILEDLLDDKELYYIDEIVDDGDRIISDIKIYAYKERKKLYDMFMDGYIKFLDGYKKKEVAWKQ